MIVYKVIAVCSLLFFPCPVCDCETGEDDSVSATPTVFRARGTKVSGSGRVRSRLNFSTDAFGRGGYQDLGAAAEEQDDARKAEATDGPAAGERGGGEEFALAGGLREMVRILKVCQRKAKGEFDGGRHPKSGTKILEQARVLYDCVKISSFRELDDFLSQDVIPVTQNLDLVKKVDAGTMNPRGSRSSVTCGIDVVRKNWTHLAWERVRELFEKHALKLRLGEDSFEGRGRRRDHRMFAMMMMGFMIMASILVPMGFQFLTVLGGKSLLMAKMALIMSAINGLKKIATSNVGYGLYHAAGPDAYHHDPHHHGFHDKIFTVKPQEQGNLPFNLVI